MASPRPRRELKTCAGPAGFGENDRDGTDRLVLEPLSLLVARSAGVGAAGSVRSGDVEVNGRRRRSQRGTLPSSWAARHALTEGRLWPLASCSATYGGRKAPRVSPLPCIHAKNARSARWSARREWVILISTVKNSKDR